jgi:hypothetical protein
MHQSLRTLSPQSAGQCKVLGLDGDPLSMDGGKIRVFEQRYKICLGGFLQRHDSRRLEPQIGLQSSMATMRQCSQTERGRETHFEVLCNLTHKPLEGKLANEEFCRLLVPSDFTQSDGTGAEPMWLLHTPCGCLQTSHGQRSVIRHGRGREQEPTYGSLTGR